MGPTPYRSPAVRAPSPSEARDPTAIALVASGALSLFAGLAVIDDTVITIGALFVLVGVVTLRESREERGPRGDGVERAPTFLLPVGALGERGGLPR